MYGRFSRPRLRRYAAVGRYHTCPPPVPMKKVVLLLVATLASTAVAQQPTSTEVAAWQREAQAVTIVRDDWGIPHIRGKTDADAVFGLMYAQAEDDFNRVEMNYINAMGRLAEVEGEGSV